MARDERPDIEWDVKTGSATLALNGKTAYLHGPFHSVEEARAAGEAQARRNWGWRSPKRKAT